MPGVDFEVLRREITMQQVLNEIGFKPTHRNGDQLYGRCPIHGTTSANRRVFSENFSKGRYYCHQCKSYGNPLELDAAVHDTTVYQAAIALGSELGHDVPWIKRW